MLAIERNSKEASAAHTSWAERRGADQGREIAGVRFYRSFGFSCNLGGNNWRVLSRVAA